MAKKIILHLCADLGSDSRFYQLDDNYEVILIGEKIGVENYEPPKNVHGVIANPVCTEFSTAQDFRIRKDLQKGMFLVEHCQRIIEKAKPKWWVIENPANGRLKEFLGKPKMTMHFFKETIEKAKKQANGVDTRTKPVLPLQNVNRWAYLYDNFGAIMLGMVVAFTASGIFTMIENIVVKIALIINGG